jgi:1,4-alpha-glucan branching enzyme
LSRSELHTKSTEPTRYCTDDQDALSTRIMQRFLGGEREFYQIYPRSFQDSNGDGIGDLPGIINRMPYLLDLGVDAVWLSPNFPSPMADFGCGISNYLDVHPISGDLDDFGTLVAAAHASNLKVILNLVPNHTSDQHPWFIESRSLHDNCHFPFRLMKIASSKGTLDGGAGSLPQDGMTRLQLGRWVFQR